MTTPEAIAVPDSRSLIVAPYSDGDFAITSWGERARPRLRRAQTGGQLALLDYGAPKSFGPPRHLHYNDDEIFEVLEGTLALWTPAECLTARPGDVVLLPKRLGHTWRAYGEDQVRLRVTVAPGEFETFFELIAQRNLTLSDVPQIAEAASAAGMDILGPPLNDEEVAAIVRGEQI
jgi:mannose-6-phosphate isomerase-like protein (cupin superfamily)